MGLLIASCIRQNPMILREFLGSLDSLRKRDGTEYYFILNNLGEESMGILMEWVKGKPVVMEQWDNNLPYETNGRTHEWNPELVSFVIEMKNRIIEKGKEYDHLLFIDSDNLLHPETLNKLLSRKKDIITEICWTKWTPESMELPNVWGAHPYEFPDGLMIFKKKMLLPVAGFGGLYLISKRALLSGVNFSRVEGKPKGWGEDRHFAIRAVGMGFSLWCDTTLPTFHFYRLTDAPEVIKWKMNGCLFPIEDYSVQRGTVLIAVCIGEGEIHHETMAWIINTLRRNPSWGLEVSRMHPIDSNRNAVVKKMLTLPQSHKYEWLLFLDSDVVPPNGAAERLIGHDKNIVGGICFIMGNDGFPTPNISKEMDSGMHRAELIEVKGMGTGFMLIHRNVLEKVGRSPFRFRYDKWGSVTVCGEDYDFCEKAVKAGYKIYADLGVQCEHYKIVGLTELNRRIGELVSNVERSQK